MNRRTYLKSVSGLALSGIAGCTDLIESSSPMLEDTSGHWSRTTFDNQGTSSNPNVTGPTDEPSITWEAETPVEDGYYPAVLVANETVFVHGGSTVTALDVADGAIDWQTDTDLDDRHRDIREYCSAALAGDQLYLGTEKGLTVLSTEGEKRWSHEVPADYRSTGVFRAPLVRDDTVYFCMADEQKLYAFSIDGDEEWSYSFDTAMKSSPVAAEERLIVNEQDVGVHGISETGEHIWTNEIGTPGNGVLSPVIVDDLVYTTGDDGNAWFIGSYYASNGSEQWKNTRAPSVVESPTVVTETNDIVFPSWSSQLFGFDLDDGTTTWGTGLTPRRTPHPSADKNSVYIAGEDRVSRYRARGGESWNLELTGASGNITVLNNALLVGSTNDSGTCYALS